MSQTVVTVEQLSKKYKIGAPANNTGLAEALTAFGKRLVTRAEATPAHELWALRDVSFKIGRGEVFGIIGANGSGKSTLLKILSRVTDPTRGRAILRGRFCGLLEVGTGFHPELTGRDNVYMSGAILGMKRKEIDNKFDEIVEFAEVERFIDTPVKHYSSGMYVRLGFSVLAHMDPDILIVDEVLAVGDIRFQRKCMGKMEDVGQHGRTVILVSHDMAAIRRLCARAILLSHGEIVREGAAIDVVNQFLSQGHLQASREWPDGPQAPGSEVVRLCAIRVKDETGVVREAFDIREPIFVEMEYEVIKAGHRCVAEFAFRNEEDVALFIVLDRDPEWYRRPRPLGRYRSTVMIPGNLLSDGVIRLNASLLTADPFRQHMKVEDVVGFVIHENGEGPCARGDFTGQWPGAFRPLFQWRTGFTPPQS
jgi:lipopolysaccharide transport system ATP-binding protein